MVASEGHGMSRGVVYFNHGTRCLVRLVVSLWSLRKVYKGPVAILDTDANKDFHAALRDRRLDAEVVPLSITMYRRHSAYIAKSTLWRHSPFDMSLLLDADTVIARPIDQLIGFLGLNPGLVVTRFSDWITTGNIVGNRIKRWADVPHDMAAKLARKCLRNALPAINTGVVGWRRDCPTLREWESLTAAGWRTPFTDELAMQLLIASRDHTLVGEKFNASPIYYRGRPEDAVIWHFHGGKHLRPEARPIWWPLYQECLEANVAGIRDWTPAGDPALIKEGTA
jgi:hypothetical protein